MKEEEVQASQGIGKGKGKKKNPGRNSALKRQDNFRMAKNAETVAKHTQRVHEALGILDDNGPSSLVAVVRTRVKEQSSVSVPFSITTRGVGIATALAYDRLVTSFEGKPPEVPLSIHQMFRVHLWAVHFKMHLSGTISTEMPSFTMPLVTLDPSYVRAMELVKALPSVMSVILDCVGRVETPAAT